MSSPSSTNYSDEMVPTSEQQQQHPPQAQYRLRHQHASSYLNNITNDSNPQAHKSKTSTSANSIPFQMDNDSDDSDYKDLRNSLISKRRSSSNATLNNSTHNQFKNEIQRLNYANSYLLKLPTEVLLQIFHHLERKDLYYLLTVCQEFADLIIEILWFRPNMQNDSSFKKIKSIMELSETQTHWNYRSFIKRLNLSFMTKLVDDDLLSLFIGCPKLERLTLVNCTKLTHQPITSTLIKCERLQSIDLTGVTDIHDNIILALAENCTRLQGLYAPGCGKVSELAIIKLLKSCPMLKRVKFNNLENITDALILAMYENCKSLVEIDLHTCSNVTDKYLQLIFRYMTQLREFRISCAPKVTDDLFNLLPEDFYLEKLRIIDITNCNAITDKLVEKLVFHAPRIRNVVLSKCMQITDALLRALSQLGRSLHYIHLGHCLLITDFGVASLVRSCHRIQYIDLACCTQLTDWTLVELSNLPKLRRIGLVKCNLISDNGILEFVRRRGEQDCLERVHLSYCSNLTIGPIYLLLKNCPKLTHLSLTGIVAFLRNDITTFCREPPPDFTESQRNSFCVFSGHGVNQLRNFLTELMEENQAHILNHGDMHAIALERRRFLLNGGNIANNNPNNNPDNVNDVNNSPNVTNMRADMTNANNGPIGIGIGIEGDDMSPGNGGVDVTQWIGERIALPQGLGENVGTEEMRGQFQMMIRNHHQNRIRRQQIQQYQMQQQQQQQQQLHMADESQEGGPETGPQNPEDLSEESFTPQIQFGQNAPQLFQPAVFRDRFVYNGNGEEEDVDMEQHETQNVNLFPRPPPNGS